jgi:hypothetical protein
VATQTVIQDATPGWSRGVLESFYRIAFARPHAEDAGLLVGGVEPSGGAHVRAVIPLDASGIAGAAAAFSHRGWAFAHDVMARHYPGLEIVGWYVSRPAGPAALTADETLAHERWFPQPHAVALVLDSRSMRGSLVGWRDGRLTELHEGPIERRYTHAPPQRVPWPAYGLLALCGGGIGAGLHLLTTHLT